MYYFMCPYLAGPCSTIGGRMTSIRGYINDTCTLDAELGDHVGSGASTRAIHAFTMGSDEIDNLL